MSVVRPKLLADTFSMAGYDHLDPIAQWFLGGTATSGAEATGINDDDRYGLELQNVGSGGKSFKATSGNGLHQVKVDNTGVTISGTVAGGATLVGEVKWLAGSTVPAFYLACDGSVVSQASYSALFAAIGTTWNTGGEGGGNFRLPNLAGRMPMGSGGGFTVGQTGGDASGYAHTHPGSHSHGLQQHDHGSGTFRAQGTTAINDVTDIAQDGTGEDVQRQDHDHEVDVNITGTSARAELIGTNTEFTSTEGDSNAHAADYDGSDFRPPYAVLTAVIYAGI